jgi:serine protease AprX
MRVVLIAAAIAFASVASEASEAKIGPRLRHALTRADGSTELAVWVFFTDKAGSDRAAIARAELLVSEKSLARRGKLLPADQLVDATDVPVNEAYVAEVARRVVSLRHRSKWFNAVSAVVLPHQVADVASLPGVREVELMARFKRGPSLGSDESPDYPSKTQGNLAKPHALNYGPSLGQAERINVPPVHDLGYTGWGVTIAVFDNGFRLLEHEALTHLNIVATYDFVDKKIDVAPVNSSPGFGAHGINCLSLLAGNSPGNLIGPAFGANFILIRSENDSSETPVEEDYWVAGIEWADSIGVDVTSTSLGYLAYDLPYQSWTWENMDGQTTVITRAAVMAASKGIVVVNSAGNEGNNTTHNTLNAPADADGILAVGSVSSNGLRSGFSSVGPTMDGRIKPDVMAQGSGVYYASAYTATSFENFSAGTSFACPQVAGVAALLLEAHPSATPALIIDALRKTADNFATPDNLVGWGTINAQAALAYLGTADSGGNPTLPSACELQQNYPNPFNPSTTIAFSLPEPSTVAIRVYDVMGQKVRTLYDGSQRLPAGSYGTAAGRPGFRWFGDDENGIGVASGVYFVRMEALGMSGRSTVLTRKMMLLR